MLTNLRRLMPVLMIVMLGLSALPIGVTLAGNAAAPAAQSFTCPTTSSNSYLQGAMEQWDYDNPVRPAWNHADKNLALRSYGLTSALKDFVVYTTPDPTQPPQFSTIFSPDRTPYFSNVYRVNNWSWGASPDPGTRSTPVTTYPVTALGMPTTPGEVLQSPTHGYDLGAPVGRGGAFVLFADADSIALVITRGDSAALGYVVHIDGVCPDPNLLALYNSLDNTTRNTYTGTPRDGIKDYNLPALRQGDPIGVARGAEIVVAIADTGSFQDPRSRDDWWIIRQPRSNPPPPSNTPSAGVEYYETNDARFSTTGSWVTYSSSLFSGGSSPHTSVVGSTMSFNFSGTGFTLYRQIATNRGMMEVCIDGACQQTNNYGTSGTTQVPVNYTGFPQATHTVVIRHLNGGFLEIDAVQVDGASSPTAIPTSTSAAAATITNTPLPTSTIAPTATKTSIPTVSGTTLGVGYYETNDTRVSTTGTWITYSSPLFSGGSSPHTNVVGSTMTFSFSGTGITLYRQITGNRGVMAVCIDGACQQTNNYGTSGTTQVPVNYTGFPQATHTVVIRHLNGGYLELDAIRVLNDAAAPTAVPTNTPLPTATKTSTPAVSGTTLGIGYYETNDTRISTAGSWFTYNSTLFSGGSSPHTSVVGSTMSFKFNGASLTLYRQIAHNRGVMEVCIDGICQQTNNYGTSGTTQVPVKYTGFPQGTHTVVIRHLNGSYLEIDAIRVE